MALINCPECGSSVSDKASACPKCGYPIQDYLHSGGEASSSEFAEAEGMSPVSAENKITETVTAWLLDRNNRRLLIVFFAALAAVILIVRFSSTAGKAANDDGLSKYVYAELMPDDPYSAALEKFSGRNEYIVEDLDKRFIITPQVGAENMKYFGYPADQIIVFRSETSDTIDRVFAMINMSKVSDPEKTESAVCGKLDDIGKCVYSSPGTDSSDYTYVINESDYAVYFLTSKTDASMYGSKYMAVVLFRADSGYYQSDNQ